MFKSVLATIAKYGILIREWRGLCYALLEVSINKIALWNNVRVDDWTAERIFYLGKIKWQLAYLVQVLEIR